MIFSRENLEDFVGFIQLAYGLSDDNMIVHDPPRNGEHARFILAGSPFFVIAPENTAVLPPSPEASPAYYLQLVGSNKEQIKTLEAMWLTFVEGADICTPEIPSDE